MLGEVVVRGRTEFSLPISYVGGASALTCRCIGGDKKQNCDGVAKKKYVSRILKG